MKIRNGFISNSSSSSFIFTIKEELLLESEELINKLNDLKGFSVFKDNSVCEKIDFDEVLDIFKHYSEEYITLIGSVKLRNELEELKEKQFYKVEISHHSFKRNDILDEIGDYILRLY